MLLKRLTKFFLVALGLLLLVLFFLSNQQLFFRPTESDIASGVGSDDVSNIEDRLAVEVVAEGLEIPWDIVFLPDGRMLVTERTGSLQVVDGPQIAVDFGTHRGEGGLLGIVLHPDFEENRWIYLYMTASVDGGLENRIERYRLEDDELSDKTVILSSIPGAIYHDGGRMAFGPDGYLYVTTGDATNASNAQNLDTLAGKILRMDEDGEPVGDSYIYSYGHRNPQGIAWDSEGRLWSTEHGRSGLKTGMDELNLIEEGKNYGWPTIEGEEEAAGMTGPVRHSGPNETWAPADLVYFEGSLFFTGLRGESLYEAIIDTDGGVSEMRSHFRSEWGRLRAMEISDDGYLYISTSNRDGRGNVRDGDDKIIRIDLNVL